MKDGRVKGSADVDVELGLEEVSYKLFKLLTSKSDMDFAPAPPPGLTGPSRSRLPIVGLLGPLPALKPRSRLDANLAARASGEGRIAQRGLRRERMDWASGDLDSVAIVASLTRVVGVEGVVEVRDAGGGNGNACCVRGVDVIVGDVGERRPEESCRIG